MIKHGEDEWQARKRERREAPLSKSETAAAIQ
jgi:hypothetical protein